VPVYATEPLHLQQAEDRVYVTERSIDYYVPPSDGSTPGVVRDLKRVHWVRSHDDIKALERANNWPDVQEVHPNSVVVVKAIPVNTTEPQFIWYVRFGVEGRWLRDCQFQVMYKMPSAFCRKYLGYIAQKHGVQHSSLIINYMPEHENKRVLNAASNGFPVALRKHSRDARMRSKRLLRGTLRALAFLIVLRSRAAERVYAPGEQGFQAAKLSFGCGCALQRSAAKRQCA